jgi:2-dehydropantoate 2-reductase
VPIERAAPRDWATDHRAYEITALFNEAGLKAQVSADIDGLVWGKVVLNAAINPLTAILRIPNGALLESNDTLELTRAVANEAAAIANAKHITLPYPNAFERVKQVAQLTATNHSSMLQDVLGKRPTEIDAINGQIVEQGQALGVPTPINAALTSLVRAIEANRNISIEEETQKIFAMRKA